jgi:LmbE family N-acetylglucosaminyl deacetylase
LATEGQFAGLEPFAEVTRAIVVCAHADDMETMMGGLAALLSERGVDLFELICTTGNTGTHDLTLTPQRLAEIRRTEARLGATMLGFREMEMLGYNDGELEPSLDLRATIASFYRHWQADALFTFDPSWAGQIHPDHRAVGRAALDALIPSRMELYHPEQLANGVEVGKVNKVFLFSPATTDLYVDVTDIYPKKVAACVAHVSQFPEGEANLDWMRRLDSESAKMAGLEGKLFERFAELTLW